MSAKPREIAARVLQQRRAGGEFTEDLLETALDGAKLPPADRALCQEIVYGVVRWQAALDWLIARKTAGRIQKAGLRDVLRLGLYQVFWLDRIPDHAAVNETVALAKLGGFGAQAGFVNAVLRGYLREAEATRRRLTELKTAQPHLGYSHPEWLVARWQQRWGAARTAQLLDWNNTPPKTYARANSLKWSSAGPARAGGTAQPGVPALIERWREENVEYDFKTWEWTGENLVFLLKSHPPLASLPSFRDGWFYVQDPSTLLGVRELDPRPGETVLDLCAAPGGKTTFLAQWMRNEGRIVAVDVSAERLKLVEENCSRLGVTCVDTVVGPLSLSPHPGPLPRGEGEFEQDRPNPQSKIRNPPFDRVLVDVPCSNTGAMRRRVGAPRWRIQPRDIERVRVIQLGLLRQAAAFLKPGGVLIYSTCSLEPEENGEVVKQFLSEHADFKLRSERELLPFVEGVDGAYVAALVKAR